MESPLEILKKYWGHSAFRYPQKEIIETVLKGENSLVLLPTGGGKSICYQIPALAMDGVCIVISPLIALIQDQVNTLKEKNIKAIALTSQLSQDEIVIAFDNLQFGGIKFVYLSPEKLQSKFIQEKIKQLNVSLIAIDEAHCISEWGHDFRPSYLQLNILHELQPTAIYIALTATATQKVLEDIQLNLALEKATVFKKSFQRKNLSYHVLKTEDIYAKLVQLLKRAKGSVIVYTNNRKQTKEVSQFLNRQEFNTRFYHGGLTNAEKNEAYLDWMSDTSPIMIATNAFGMGIDKPNVRVVIHINTPNSIENFIQEAGRAGRDGEQSHAVIITNDAILHETASKFSANLASVAFIKKVYFNLNQYFNISLGEIPLESFDFSLQKFCSLYQFNLLQTFNAIKSLERENIIVLDENYTKKSTLKFLINNQQLFSFLESNGSKSALIQLILRSYGGVFEHYTIINEYVLSKKLKISKNKVIKSLKELTELGIIRYFHANTTSKLQFLAIREDNYTINRISKNIEQQNNLKQHKLEAVIRFIKNKKTCRSIQLLSYFNEITTKACGSCDVCLSKNTKNISLKTVVKEILTLLKNKELSSFEISSILNHSEKDILNSLKILLEQDKITITSHNKFKQTI